MEQLKTMPVTRLKKLPDRKIGKLCFHITDENRKEID